MGERSGMRWATGRSTAESLDDALDEAVAGVARALAGERPDLVLLFATPHHTLPEDLPARVRARLGGLLVGCSAGGVIGGGEEIERRAALSLTAAVLPGVRVAGFHLPGPAPDPAALAARLGVAPDERPAFLLLADPFTADAQALAASLDGTFRGSVTVGGLASGGGAPGEHTLVVGDQVIDEGAVGIALSGPITVDALVAQGCRPIGQPMFATRCEGNHLQELNGRPALAVLRELYETLDEEDRVLFRRSLFFGIVMDEGRTEYRAGDFLIRNVLGRAQSDDALVVGAPLSPLQVVQFHLRDARTSADELQALLDGYRRSVAAPPSGALLFSCLGRGEGLYGVPGHDSGLFRSALGDVPLGGFFCNGELGPIAGTTYLHGYTSSFALFR